VRGKEEKSNYEKREKQEKTIIYSEDGGRIRRSSSGIGKPQDAFLRRVQRMPEKRKVRMRAAKRMRKGKRTRLHGFRKGKIQGIRL